MHSVPEADSAHTLIAEHTTIWLAVSGYGEPVTEMIYKDYGGALVYAKGAKASTCARGRNELSTRLQCKIRAERASLGWWHVGRRERAAGGGEGQLRGADLYGFEVLHRHLLGGRGARIGAMTAGCRPKCSGIRAG